MAFLQPDGRGHEVGRAEFSRQGHLLNEGGKLRRPRELGGSAKEELQLDLM